MLQDYHHNNIYVKGYNHLHRKHLYELYSFLLINVYLNYHFYVRQHEEDKFDLDNLDVCKINERRWKQYVTNRNGVRMMVN